MILDFLRHVKLEADKEARNQKMKKTNKKIIKLNEIINVFKDHANEQDLNVIQFFDNIHTYIYFKHIYVYMFKIYIREIFQFNKNFK